MKKIKLVGLLLGIIGVFSFSLNAFAGSENSLNEIVKEDRIGFSGKLKCSFKNSGEMKRKVKDNTEKLMVIYSKIKEAMDYTINEIKKDKRWDFKVIENRKEDILDNILSNLSDDFVFHNNEGYIFLTFGKSFYIFFKKVLNNLDKVKITKTVFKENKNGIVDMMKENVKRQEEYVKIQKTAEWKKSYEKSLKFWKDYIKKVEKVDYETFKLVEKNYIRPKDLEERRKIIKLDDKKESKEVFGKLKCSFKDSEEMKKKLKDNTEKLMVIYSKIKEALSYIMNKEPNKISKKDYDLILFYISHQFCLPDNRDDEHITYGLHHNNSGYLFFNLSEDGYKFFKKVLSNLDKVKITEEVFEKNKKEIVRIINKEIKKGEVYMKKTNEGIKRECKKAIEELKENIKKVKGVDYKTFKLVEKNYIRPKDLEERAEIKGGKV